MTNTNEKLCEVFEMLVSRMDTLETNQLAVIKQLNLHQLALRYRDAERDWDDSFSCVHWTGDCLQLKVHTHMNIDGEFTGSMDPNDIYVIKTESWWSSPDDDILKSIKNIPGVIAAGNFCFAMQDCDSMQTVIKTAKDLHRLGLDVPTHLEVHIVPERFVPLAMSIINGFGEQEAFAALSSGAQASLKYRTFFKTYMYRFHNLSTA